MRPRTLLHPTETFYVHFDKLHEALGDFAEELENDLAKTLKGIAAHDWDDPLPATQHGSSGRDFAYPINKRFVLVVSVQTDRTGEGVPLMTHLYLKTIEHVPIDEK